MSATVLRLRGEPDQRLDLSAIAPATLADASEAEIAALPVGTTRVPCRLGEAFAIELRDRDRIRFVGGSDRLDGVGARLSAGVIEVEGSVGCRAGFVMSGGRLAIEGSAGPQAGAAMAGGTLLIGGNCEAGAGGAVPGAMSGMRGGLLSIAGSAGDRLGDRMRRGVIAVAGEAGRYAGSRMRGGTLIAAGVGAMPGYLMRRGSLVCGRHGPLLPTFVSSGVQELEFLALLRSWLAEHEPRLARLVPRRAERRHGDMATLGRGELLIAAD